MKGTIDGRVRRSGGKKTRTARKRTRELSNEERQRLRENALSRPRGPDGRFLPNQTKKDCAICAESKWAVDFPTAHISENCNHELGACLECIRHSIKADFGTKQWTEIGCPECAAHLDFNAIAKYADAETFARYVKLSVQMAVREIPGFAWCPHEGCTCGQINVPDEDCPAPISAICYGCNEMYCLKHNKAWHHDLTCEEFDIILQGPDETKDLAKYERLQARMDQAKIREMRRRAEEDRVQAELSEKLIMKHTVKCPRLGCGWQIEKVGGCDMMFCTMCKNFFCWSCGNMIQDRPLGDSGHAINCPHYQEYQPPQDWQAQVQAGFETGEPSGQIQPAVFHDPAPFVTFPTGEGVVQGFGPPRPQPAPQPGIQPAPFGALPIRNGVAQGFEPFDPQPTPQSAPLDALTIGEGVMQGFGPPALQPTPQPTSQPTRQPRQPRY